MDSSLVAFLARHFLGRERTLALVSASPSLKESDLETAKDFAQRNDIPLKIVMTREIEDPNYFNNPNNRCYFCKHTLYDHLSDYQNNTSKLVVAQWKPMPMMHPIIVLV